MSASQAPAFDAIAPQLLAALDKYDRDAVAVLASWQDLDLYQVASQQLDEVRLYTASLPDVRVQWVALLIHHAELVHCLWRVQYGREHVDARQVAEVRERHADAIAALRSRCLRLIHSGNHRRF